MRNIVVLLSFLLFAIMATACEVIGDIFGAGFYTGIFIVIAVIILIVIVIVKIRR